MLFPFLLLVALAVWWLHQRSDAVVSLVTEDPADMPKPNPEDTPASGATVDGYVRGTPTPITVAAIDDAGHVLRDDAARAFIDMRDAAAREGVELRVNSAWRSHAQQGLLYAAFKAGTGNLAAPPGYSNHQSGIDVDIESAGGTNDAARWLAQNAASHGFVRTVAGEPWHWEYDAATVRLEA